MRSILASPSERFLVAAHRSISIPSIDAYLSAIAFGSVLDIVCSIQPYGYSMSAESVRSGSLSGPRAIFIVIREFTLSISLQSSVSGNAIVDPVRIPTSRDTESMSGTSSTRRVRVILSSVIPFSITLTVYGISHLQFGEVGTLNDTGALARAWTIRGSLDSKTESPVPNLTTTSVLVIFLVALNTLNVASKLSPG
jgi:hypothetical protein